MDDDKITTDIKNHRVRVLENIDIEYKGIKYNMFFEFLQGEHWNYRTTNKRTGAPLKKGVREIVIKDGLFIDTQFEREEKSASGYTYQASYRKADLEREFYLEHHAFTRRDILEVVNRYKVGKKFDKVVLIEQEARRIINTIGGYREKEILGDGKDFHTAGDSYFSIGETWNDEHKIVRCNKREWKPCGDGKHLEVVDFCEVDLVTGKITA